MVERRRSARYSVHDIAGSLRIAFNARLRACTRTTVTVETAHGLRVGRAYLLTLGARDGIQICVRGALLGCQLEGVRKSSAGAALYRADLGLDEPLPEELGEQPQRQLLDPVRLETSLDLAVRSISAHGALIELDRELLTGGMLDVHIHLPDRLVAARIRVVFSRELKHPDGTASYQHGVEFVTMPAASHDALDAFLAVLASTQPVAGVTA